MPNTSAPLSLVDVSATAKLAGCDFEVWFSRSLWDWCRQSPRGPGLWSREGGLLCSLSYLADAEQLPSGPARLKTAGERVEVELDWLGGRQGMQRLIVSFAHERGSCQRADARRLIDQSVAATGKANGELPYYFVCTNCDAKWFARSMQSKCPRCEAVCSSTQQIEPPWRTHLRSFTTNRSIFDAGDD